MKPWILKIAATIQIGWYAFAASTNRQVVGQRGELFLSGSVKKERLILGPARGITDQDALGRAPRRHCMDGKHGQYPRPAMTASLTASVEPISLTTWKWSKHGYHA
ncbi:MAG: hypothetical protein M0C28_22135 [Candidatus Moduliflexus flocculans]|nr:hypothetical protein [Candidatus Moduliflexus flocculans]